MAVKKSMGKSSSASWSKLMRDRKGKFIPAGIEGAQQRAEAVAVELESPTPWIPVSSSNVEAIRWVGGQYGLQVKFLAKKHWPSSTYEYLVGYSTFLEMQEANSKGKFVWGMRYARIPYRRIAGGRGGLKTIIYPFGGIRMKKGKKALKFPKMAVGEYYKHWATPGYHPPGTHKKF